jgi:hypothetical protein
LKKVDKKGSIIKRFKKIYSIFILGFCFYIWIGFKGKFQSNVKKLQLSHPQGTIMEFGSSNNATYI